MAADDPLPEEAIERFRRSGLRLDRDARWWHEGEPVRHAGLSRALHRWLDRLPDGRHVVRLDAERYAYVEVEDAPLVARSARLEAGAGGERVLLWLSDETEEALDPTTLARRGGELYAQARGGRLACRLAPQAVYALAERLGEAEGRATLELAGRRWPIDER